jgi:hypothetical protein
MKQYSKFQFSWLITIAFFVVIVWINVAYFYQWGNIPIPKIGYIILLVIMCGVLLTFYGMTVTIDEKQIIIRLGIGLFRKKIDLSTIKSAEVIVYPPYYGYGIRLIPKGILYNVSGKHAVELKFNNKKRVVLIGTNDWENLKQAIEKNLKNQIN